MLFHLTPQPEQSWTLADAVRPRSSRVPRWAAHCHVSEGRSQGANRRHPSHIRIQRNALLMGCFRSHGDATTNVTPSLTGRHRSFS